MSSFINSIYKFLSSDNDVELHDRDASPFRLADSDSHEVSTINGSPQTPRVKADEARGDNSDMVEADSDKDRIEDKSMPKSCDNAALKG